ncbi:MAG: ABC transporter permease [Ignavibacteria bacterium]|nr:ABC transporter permease [Ignavibacteria bacterium]
MSKKYLRTLNIETLLNLIKYIIRDIIRSKFLVFYTVSLILISLGIRYINRDDTKTYITVLNIIIYLMPLINLLFTSLHFYNSREFIETILTYPVSRSKIFFAEYFSLVIAQSISFIIGIIIPLVLYSFSPLILWFFISGIFLTFIFTAVSFLSAVVYEERLKGIGSVIGIWLLLSVVYDGIIMLLYFMLSDFPLDKTSLILVCLNPVDLSRIFILMNLDISALFGYTGANFIKFFGASYGMAISIFASLLWVVIPFILALKKFSNKDF